MEHKVGDTQGYARLLELDLDINKLEDVIRGVKKEEL